MDLWTLMRCHPTESVKFRQPMGNSSRSAFHLVSQAFYRLCNTTSPAKWSVFTWLGLSHSLDLSWKQEAAQSLRPPTTNHSVCLYLIPTSLVGPRGLWKSSVWGRSSSPYTLGPDNCYLALRKSDDFTPATLSLPSGLPSTSSSHWLCSYKFPSYIQVRSQMLSNKPYSYFPEMRFPEFTCSGCSLLNLAKFHFLVTLLVPMLYWLHRVGYKPTITPDALQVFALVSGIRIHHLALAFWTSNQIIPLELRVVFEHVFYLFRKTTFWRKREGRD